MKKITDLWWVAGLRGLVLLVLGIFVFQHPSSAILGLVFYISISLLLIGVTQVVFSLATKKYASDWGWGLASGIIEVVFAFILMSNPGLTAATLPFIVGFWIVVQGILTFVNSFEIRKSGGANWWVSLLGGLFSIFIGFVIINNLLAGLLAITYWIGFGFIMAGIVNLSIAFRLRTLNK